MCAHPRSSMDLDSLQPFLKRASGSTEKDVGRRGSTEQRIYGTMTSSSKAMTADSKSKEKEAAAAGKQANDRDKGEVPDGGWGWLIVLGVSLSNMTTQALVSVFGFLFSQRLRELQIETSGAAVILSVQSAVQNLSGLYTGVLIRRYSYQKVAISGALLMMSGLLMTTLADSLISYILTYGIVTGLGLGFLYPSTFVAVNSYFSTKRGIAVGWSVTGTGVGQMLLPILVSYLLDEYGFRGTILILGALSGHSLVAAMLYQPVSMHMKHKKKVKIVESKEAPSENLANMSDNKETLKGVADVYGKNVRGLTIRRLSEPRNRSSMSLHSIELGEDDEDVCQKNGKPVSDGKNGIVKNEEKKEEAEKQGLWSKLMATLDYDLLKSGSFLIVVIGCGVIFTGNTYFQMLYPQFLESMNYSRKEVASCMVALSAFDIIGRPILPYIVKAFQVRSKTIFFVSAFLSAIFRSTLATQSSMISILILSAVCGLFRSAIITNMNLSVAEQTSSAKLPAALGLQMVMKGLFSLSLGPLIGIIRDESHSFELCIHILSVFFLGLPFLAFLLERLCVKKPS